MTANQCLECVHLRLVHSFLYDVPLIAECAIWGWPQDHDIKCEFEQSKYQEYLKQSWERIKAEILEEFSK